MTEKEHIIIESGDAVQPFAYSVGMHGSKFSPSYATTGALWHFDAPSARKCISRRGAVCGDCFVE